MIVEKLAIVGTGLIGGSFALALKQVGAVGEVLGEACVMCAGAIYWSGIRRVVFGIDAVSLRSFRAPQAGAADLQMSCRDVFASSAEPFTVIGPALDDEAVAPHPRPHARCA